MTCALFSGIAIPAYSQLPTYTFLTCGATGPVGPTQTQVTNAYSSTNLAGLVTVNSATPGVQLFTVPNGAANIGIECYGAQGGNGTGTGGSGAIMKGEFVVPPGTVLKIIVGQRGLTGSNQGGGGGGSFVTTLNDVPLCIAGGGGGGYYSSYTYSAATAAGQTVTTGNPGIHGSNAAVNAMGGTNGSGAPAGPNYIGSGQGAGGGGFLTDGGGGLSGSNGYAFKNGGKGGVEPNANSSMGNGGFGGGGAGEWSNWTGSGGGGGYSGGGGGVYYGVGGGAGSYNAGTNQVNTPGANTGDGKVIIKMLCDVTVLSTSNPICYGQSVGLSTNAQGNISWGGGQTTSSITVSPSVTTTYSVTGNGTGGCSTTALMTVTVNPLPNLQSMITPSVLCVGNTATVVAGGANSFTWASTGSATPMFTIDPTATTGYSFSGTNQYGCINTTVATVIVNTNSLTVTSNTSICSGTPLNLSVSGANTYSWSTGSLFSNAPVTPMSTTTYTVAGTDVHNCVISNSVLVTVHPLPNVAATTNNGTVCKGESATLSASGASTYVWSTGGTSSQVNVTLPVDVVYTYTVTGTDANGCKKSAVVSVTASKCAGVDELSGLQSLISLYPNPAANELTIENNSGVSALVEVMDLTGKVVLSTSVKDQKTKVDVSSLSSGVYNVRLKAKDAVDVIKIVKQ